MSEENEDLPQEEPTEKDAFDELISNQPEDDPDIDTMWDGVKVLWKAMGNEGILVKGVLILEYIDARGKVLKWESAPDMAPWDMLGMFHQAINDLNNDAMVDTFVSQLVNSEDEDDDDVEDEQ